MQYPILTPLSVIFNTALESAQDKQPSIFSPIHDELITNYKIYLLPCVMTLEANILRKIKPHFAA